jgi:hypothetical protein
MPEPSSRAASPRQMAKIAEQAQNLKASLKRVRGTVLAKHLADRKLIEEDDLLDRRLDELARNSGIGPGKRPDFREDIEQLAQIVKKSCG